MKKRKFKPRLCACRCGQLTREGYFIKGHDEQMYSAILKEVGGLLALRNLVEDKLGRQIKCDVTEKSTTSNEKRKVVENH